MTRMLFLDTVGNTSSIPTEWQFFSPFSIRGKTDESGTKCCEFSVETNDILTHSDLIDRTFVISNSKVRKRVGAYCFSPHSDSFSHGSNPPQSILNSSHD